jgi:hypothetical protein
VDNFISPFNTNTDNFTRPYNTNLHPLTLGHAVAQLAEALRFKPEGREFDSRWCHRHCSLTLAALSLLTAMSTRTISWGKGDRYVWLPLTPSCAIVLKSGRLNLLEPSGSVQACTGMALPFFFTFTLSLYI